MIGDTASGELYNGISGGKKEQRKNKQKNWRKINTKAAKH